MNSLRTRWMASGTSVLLALSVLLLAVAPALASPQPEAPQARADWLRTQLAQPGDAGVEAALERAAKASATSLHTFVYAFVHAYEEAHPDVDVATLFTEVAAGDEVFDVLASRYQRLVGVGVLPHAILVAAHTKASSSHQRTDQGSQAVVASVLRVQHLLVPGQLMALPVVVVPFRFLSSARSLGP